MAGKKEILKKIRILITQKYSSPEEAFAFFDKKSEGSLGREELKELIRDAKVSRFLSGIVADKMIDGLDTDGDARLNWKEFKQAVNDLMKDVA
ncbi:MAG: hypothetical protein KTR24_17000 [Saprospiraceae bacterium]|nr:hypothetical protein [Saprospiraceae bacterium]